MTVNKYHLDGDNKKFEKGTGKPWALQQRKPGKGKGKKGKEVKYDDVILEEIMNDIDTSKKTLTSLQGQELNHYISAGSSNLYEKRAIQYHVGQIISAPVPALSEAREKLKEIDKKYTVRIAEDMGKNESRNLARLHHDKLKEQKRIVFGVQQYLDLTPEKQDVGDKYLDVAKKLGIKPEPMGTAPFIFHKKNGDTLTFGYVDGPLGWDIVNREGEIKDSNQMEDEYASAEDQVAFMRDVADTYGFELK